MKSMTVDATLHARAELMKEFKVGRQAECDPDMQIGVLREREAELVGGMALGEAMLLWVKLSQLIVGEPDEVAGKLVQEEHPTEG